MHRHNAFTLIELLVTVAIIGILMALLMVTVGMIRERASRVECLNNLRTIGMGDQLYANDNRGFLIMRGEGHQESAGRLDQYFGDAISTVTDYIPARAWFCPQWYPQNGHSGLPIESPGRRATTEVKNQWMKSSFFGYAFYRMANNSSQGWHESQPGASSRGMEGQPFGTGRERRAIDLLPGSARVGEMYANIDNYSHNGQAPALGWWHLGSGGKPSGGNVLRGDLSGGWAEGSSVMYTFQATFVYTRN